jgi:hypothetical protein
VIAYIYFDSQDQEYQTALNVFASLLKQLAVRLKEMSPTITSMYNRHRIRRTRPELSELVECILSISAQFSSSFILLDALDECERSQRQKILNAISRIHSGGVSILATGRHHIANVDYFKSSPTINIRADIKDLRHFLTQKLAEARLENAKLDEEIVEILSTNADGLYAHYYNH